MRNLIGLRKLAAIAVVPVSMLLLGMFGAAPASPGSGEEGAPRVAVGKGAAGMVEAGRVPFEQRLRDQYLADHGTQFSLGVLEDTPQHRQVLKEISAAGRSEKDRVGRYAWLNKMYPDIRFNGWSGVLLGVEPTPGGLKVTLAITPRVSRPREHAMTVMGLRESYILTDEGLVYLTTEPEGVPPGVVTFN